MKTQKLRYGILAADLCWGVAAMGLSYVLRYGTKQASTSVPISAFTPFVISTLFFWCVLCLWLRLDGFNGGWRFSAILSQLFLAILTLMALLFAGAYLDRLYLSRLALGYFGVLFFIGVVTIRVLARVLVASRYRSGAVRKTVIVGGGPIANEIARKIECHPEMLLKIVGFLYPAEHAAAVASNTLDSIPIYVRSVGIVDLLQSHEIDELILAVPKPGHPEISDLVARCLNRGIAVSVVPQPYELYLSRPLLVDLDGLPLLKFEGVPAVQMMQSSKRLLDVVVSLCLLPLAVPVLLAAVLLKIRKGRGFRAEIRCGQFGKTFWMYRLNSERHAVGLPWYESLIQQLSLTELPQILNVLRGEMSVVGPRPEGPEKVRHYTDWQRQRLCVKPGITGLAQVHGLREQNSSEDKTRYDLQYILHRSLFFDISLILQTVWTLTSRLFQFDMQWPEPPADPRVETIFEESLSSAHRSQSSAD